MAAFDLYAQFENISEQAKAASERIQLTRPSKPHTMSAPSRG